jgi:cbb3-type cytochrome c oxidase subunit III
MRSSTGLFSRFFLVTACALLLSSGLRAADEPDAAAMFKQKCSMCHGADGKGYAAIKTPDFTDPKWQEGITDGKIVETIKSGKKGTPMPPFSDKLKEEEIQALVKYIRSLNGEKKKE